jgi:hypothetical protein
MSRKLLNLSIISVLLLTALLPPGRVGQAQELLPNIDASVTGDWLQIWGIGPDVLNARVDILRGADQDLVCSGDYDDFSVNPWLDCPESGIEPGDHIYLYLNDFQVKDHIVVDMTLDEIDIATGMVRGTGPQGLFVDAVICNPEQDCFSAQVEVQENGIWEIFFGPDTIIQGAQIWATIWETDGDSTQANLITSPFPSFEIQPDHGWVCTGGWAALVPITLTIDGGLISTFSYQDVQNTNSEGDFCFEMYEVAEQIQPGMYVSVSDGTVTKETWVREMSFDSVDEFGLASGAALFPGEGHACLGFSGEYLCLEISVETTDEWFADFGPYDPVLENLTEGHVVIPDVDGDATRVDLDLPEPPPLPIIEANVTTDSLGANDLGPEALTIRLELYYPGDNPETTDPKCSGDLYYVPEQDFSWLDCRDVGVDPGDQVYLLIEDQLIKTHVVYDLDIDGYDFEAGIMYGSGPPDRDGWVYVCNPDDTCYSDGYTTLGDGSWSVVFGPGLIDSDAWFLAAMPDEDEDRTNAEMFPEGIPSMDVNVSGDWISAWGFGFDAQAARLEVWRGEGPDLMCEGDFDLSQGDPRLECWQQDTDILPGDQVLLIVDGEQVKDHAVFDLTLDEVNTDEGYFAGTAPSDTTVRVDICNPPYEECFSGEYTIWSGFTDWSISFGEGAVDPDAWFAAFIMDEDGDQTMAEPFWAPFPWFTVHPEHGWVGGLDWPIDVPVTLTIDADDNPDNGYLEQFSQISTPAEWDPDVGEVWFDLFDYTDLLQPGTFVRLSDGEISKETMIVPLSFDVVDSDGNASGSGPEGGTGNVCLDHESGCIEITIPPSGEWAVHFDWYDPEMELYDAHVVIWDEDGDETMANFTIEEPPPVPGFEIEPNQGWSCTGGWEVGVDLGLTIDGDTDPGNGVILQRFATTTPAEWDPGQGAVCFEFYNQVEEVLPGLYVSVTDQVILKDTWVAPLTFEAVEDDGTAWGYGATEWGGHVCINDPGDCQEITVDQDGNWSAFFSGYDPVTADLSGAHVVVSDEDGDGTIVHLFQGEPPNEAMFGFNPGEQIINAVGWPLYTSISLEVNDPATSEEVDYSDSGVVTGFAPWNPGVTLFTFDTSSFEILPGFEIQLSGGGIIKSTIVTPLTVDEVDYDQQRVSGSTGMFAYLDAIGFGSMQEIYPLTSDQDGYWEVSFTQDLLSFDFLFFIEPDGDGDTTEIFYYPNHPPLAVDDSYITDEDSSILEAAPGVLGNDSDPENEPLTAALISDVLNGTVVLNTDGSFSYTPDQDYFGADSFSYIANDGERDSEEVFVSLTVNSVNDVLEVFAGPDVTLPEGQIFTGNGSFSDPDLDTWTATVDYYSDGISPQDLPLNPDQTFALSNQYPPDDGVYTLTVTVDDGSVQSSDSLVVTVQNTAPSVEVSSLAGGKDTVLTGLTLDLVTTFSDPGDDTHTAVIAWGDGSQVINPAISPLTVSHAYQAPGTYSITVTVTDDDGGAGSAAANLIVVDPSEAAQSAIEDLESILVVPGLDPGVAAALEDTIVELEGANDGASNSGAIDKIDGEQWNAALVKIAKAIQDLEGAEDSDPNLDFSEIKEELALIAKSVAVDVIELAEAVASTPDDLAAIQLAYGLIAQGQTLLDSGDCLGAVDKFQEAVQVL